MDEDEGRRFVVEGYGLAHWLWALVDEDDELRERAREAILRMQDGGMAARFADPSFDADAHLREFGDEVRASKKYFMFKCK